MQAYDEMVATERAFARASVESGTQKAFMEFLGEDSVLFFPNPVPGRQFMEARTIQGQLTWEPRFADIAAAGDLGYTTGPWRFASPGPGGDFGPPYGYGHYVTVWERHEDETWKILLDIGIDYSREFGPATGPIMNPRLESAGTHDGDEAEERAALMERDRSMATHESFAAALQANAADDIRFYRFGYFPFEGREATIDALSESDVQLVWNPEGSGVARSLDLGYTYGTARFIGFQGTPENPARVSYVRIWRREETSNWEVVLDVAIPAPEG